MALPPWPSTRTLPFLTNIWVLTLPLSSTKLMWVSASAGRAAALKAAPRLKAAVFFNICVAPELWWGPQGLTLNWRPALGKQALTRIAADPGRTAGRAHVRCDLMAGPGGGRRRRTMARPA